MEAAAFIFAVSGLALATGAILTAIHLLGRLAKVESAQATTRDVADTAWAIARGARSLAVGASHEAKDAQKAVARVLDTPIRAEDVEGLGGFVEGIAGRLIDEYDDYMDEATEETLGPGIAELIDEPIDELEQPPCICEVCRTLPPHHQPSDEY